MKKIQLNGNDIVIGEIVSKQDYSQNKIKYDSKFLNVEYHNKIFLLNKKDKSKILYSSFLFLMREFLNLKDGISLIFDSQQNKEIILLGSLNNPMDSKSLIKLEFEKDKYYEDNISTFSNWLHFSATENTSIYVYSNNKKRFKTIIKDFNLENFKFEFLQEEDIRKINNKLKPMFSKEDLFKIYAPGFLILLASFILINLISSQIINNDIAKTEKLKLDKINELTQKTQQLEDLKNEDFFKNKEHYLKLVDKKVYEVKSNERVIENGKNN